jgi:hypothetical protein
MPQAEMQAHLESLEAIGAVSVTRSAADDKAAILGIELVSDVSKR